MYGVVGGSSLRINGVFLHTPLYFFPTLHFVFGEKGK